MPATYESGSMRWFKYGRTDTIRSCTNASYAFVKSMMDKVSSVSIESSHDRVLLVLCVSLRRKLMLFFNQ